jgi:hypothetical protein
MNAIEPLKSFCKEQLLPQASLFPSYATNNPCFIFQQMRQEFCSVDLKNIAKTLDLQLAIQRQRTKNMKKTIQSFNLPSSRCVGMKGCFLQEAYYPKEVTRLHSDIDFIALPRHGCRLYKIMRKHDFELIKYRIKAYNKKWQTYCFRRF